MFIGLGTLVNAAAVALGGLAGLLLAGRMKQRMQETLTYASGVSVIFLGAAGALARMLTVRDGALEAGGTVMLVCCLALGGLIGEMLNIDGWFERFGRWLRRVTRSEGENRFLDGFLTATFTVCIGAMAVVGAIEDGMGNGCAILLTKSLLDLIIVLVMAASLGKGCVFAAIPVLAVQGAITLLARFLAPVMTPAAQGNLSLVGSVLIFCVGVNLVWPDRRIRVANLLPGLVLAVAWAFIF